MIENWGKAPDGTPVHRISISGGGLTARIITFGAALQDLRFNGLPFSLVLGFADGLNYQRRGDRNITTFSVSKFETAD